MKDKIQALLKSRRFIAAVSGVLVVVFQDVLSLTEEQAVTIVGVIASWIVGDSLNKTE